MPKERKKKIVKRPNIRFCKTFHFDEICNNCITHFSDTAQFESDSKFTSSPPSPINSHPNRAIKIIILNNNRRASQGWHRIAVNGRGKRAAATNGAINVGARSERNKYDLCN